MGNEPHKIDKIVGKNIFYLRHAREISQTQLAEACGVKFQQIQKYETGANRVSASRLWMIAEALGCTVSDLYRGAENTKDAMVIPDVIEVDLTVVRQKLTEGNLLAAAIRLTALSGELMMQAGVE